MSEQHEQHDEVVEDEKLEHVDAPVVVDEPRPSEGEVGSAAVDADDPTPYEADEAVEESADAPTYAEERYERACLDPEWARQEAIVVDEDDQGPAYEYGSLAAYEDAQRVQADQDSDHADDSEEV